MLMVNQFGNVYKEVNDSSEKNRLLKLGYKEVEKPKKENTETPKKRVNTSKEVNKDAE